VPKGDFGNVDCGHQVSHSRISAGGVSTGVILFGDTGMAGHKPPYRLIEPASPNASEALHYSAQTGGRGNRVSVHLST
jgi:hypothetical protein